MTTLRVCASTGAAPSSPATLAAATKVANDFLKSNIKLHTPYCAGFFARIEPLSEDSNSRRPPSDKPIQLAAYKPWYRLLLKVKRCRARVMSSGPRASRPLMRIICAHDHEAGGTPAVRMSMKDAPLSVAD